MDNLIKHWEPFPRRFPAAFPVVSWDLISAKRDRVNHTFATCNFSLILQGSGDFHLRGQSWPVEPPCVITQWPGQPVTYGPATTWTECFVIYAATSVPALTAANLVIPHRPIWPIHRIENVEPHLAELHRLSDAETANPSLIADRIDRIWERILLETLLTPAPAAPEDRAIRSVINHLQNHLADPADFDQLARQLGMSPPTFRRHFTALTHSPPARFLQQLRIQEACRLLAETNLAIRHIAAAVGYPDEFHFSRRFRAARGIPPKSYRQHFQIPRSPTNLPK